MRELITILWLRRRLAVHELSGLAGAVNLVAGIGLMTIAAAGALALAAGLGFVLHLAVASGDDGAVSGAWSLSLYTMAFIALGVPVLIGAGETSFDPTRLLRFPISRQRLHHLSLASELASKIHMAWYPTMVVSTVVGVVLPGPARFGPIVILVLFAVTLVTWSHALLLVVRRVLRQRRLRELAAVVGLALVLPIAFLPAVVDLSSEDVDQRLEEIFTIPGWISTAASVLPPSITARALETRRTGRWGAALTEVLWLGMWFAGGWFAGRMAFERLLQMGSGAESASAAPQPGRLRVWDAIFGRLPAATGAVATKEMRYLFQSGVGKLSLVVMPLMTALPAAMAGRHIEMQVFGSALETMVFLGVMIYAAALTGYLQVNTFAWEKAGFATYFTSPARPEEIVFGKNVAIWVFNAIFALEGLVVWSVIRGLPHPAVALTGLSVFASTTVLMSLVGNFSSIAFPVDRPIAAVTSAASPIGTLVMIGCLLVGVVVAGAATIGAGVTGSPLLQPAIALATFGLIVVGYKLSLRPASAVLGERRDEILRSLVSG